MLRPPPVRGHRHCEGGLGEPVHGLERGGVEAVPAEALDEALHHVDRDGLGAIERMAPRGQIDPLELAVRHALEAQRVGEVRAAETVPPKREIARSHRAGRARNASGGSSKSGPGTTAAQSRQPISPMSW